MRNRKHKHNKPNNQPQNKNQNDKPLYNKEQRERDIQYAIESLRLDGLHMKYGIYTPSMRIDDIQDKQNIHYVVRKRKHNRYRDRYELQST